MPIPGLSLSAALLLGAGALTPVPAAAAPSVPVLMPTLSAAKAFSPDGNGIRDTARVRFTLPRADRAKLQVKSSIPPIRVVRTVRLGRLAAGEHSWRWDGRDQRGRMLPEGRYLIRLRTATPDPRKAQDYTFLNTTFDARVTIPERYAVAARKAPAQVFPRTTVIRDAIELGVWGEGLRPSARLVIEDSSGAVVLRQTREHPDQPWTVRWTARKGGRPLPPGTYRAFVEGRDNLGNAGRSRPMPIDVSRKRLVWHEETRTSPAADLQVGACTFSSANGCGDFPPYGTVVPSERYAGGLSLRSAEGEFPGRSHAAASFYLRVPETAGVRGVHSARVTFTGSPTVTGEEDLGRLQVWGSDAVVTSTSSATTPWTTQVWLGNGQLPTAGLPRFDPGVVWSLSTRGTDSFDVAGFTVDLRYLVPQA